MKLRKILAALTGTVISAVSFTAINASTLPISAVSAEDTASTNESSNVTKDIKYSYKRYSYFSEEVAFDWTKEESIQTVDSLSGVIRSAEELSDFLKPCITESAINDYLEEYKDSFFEENILLMHTYLEPELGRTLKHDLKKAYVQNNTVLHLDFTSTIGSKICETYYLDVMQAAIPKDAYKDYKVEWKDNEVLEEGMIRFTYLDYDTGEKIQFGKDFDDYNVIPSYTFNKGYEEAGFVTTGVAPLGEQVNTNGEQVNTNPYFVEKPSSANDEYFDADLSILCLPDSYGLPDDYKRITKYENGSIDVVFRIKHDDYELKHNEMRIRVYDKGTGELIPDDVLKDHYYECRIEYDANKQRLQHLLQVNENSKIYNLYSIYKYKNDEYFALKSNDNPEITYYDNQSMDVVFRTKLEMSGNINGDNDFSVADMVTLQKWLLGDPEVNIKAWGQADYDFDNKLTTFDLCQMRKELIAKMSAEENEGYDFEDQYYRVSGRESGYPKKEIITSRSELEKYISDNDETYSLTKKRPISATESVSFVDITEKYNEKWFDKNNLLLVVFEEGSGSIRHEVTGLSKDEIRINRLVPEVGTDDMATWYVLVEVDKSAELTDNIDVKFSNVKV
ncbi:MAG: dockerin type I repeat-containing protein [Ruminococcus sp.]|nr:dockerin type I repeat-containing protein [Ruminococcus sp.]